MNIPKVIELDEQDEGFQEFKIGGKSVVVDVFKTFQDINQIVETRKTFPDQETTLIDDISKLMEEKGFGKVSHATVLRFIQNIKDIASILKKNIESSRIYVEPTQESTLSS